MTLATLAQVKKRLIQLLNANRLAYSSNVGTGAAAIGSYPFDQEVTDAAIEADAMVIVEGYFQSKLALRTPFLLPSSNLVDGDKLPLCDGLYGNVEYSIDAGVTWKRSNEAKGVADVHGLNESGAYIAASSLVGWHFVDADDGVFYSSSPISRIHVPTYVRTPGVLQALQIHESAIIAGSMMLLYKNNAQAAFEWYAQLFNSQVGRIKNGSLDMPEVGVLPGNMQGGSS